MHTTSLALLNAKLAQATTVEQVAAAIIAVGRQIVGSDGITFVVNDHGNCHYLDEDAVSPMWKGQRFPAEICVSGLVMRHRQQVTIPNIDQDARVPHDIYRRTFVKSLQMVPVGERSEAAIGAYWGEYHDPTEAESLALYSLARAAAGALARIPAA